MEGTVLTASKNEADWVFRIFDRRPISIKAKNEQVRKIAAVDVATNMPFGLDVPLGVPLEQVEVEKAYTVRFKVYTARNAADVAPDYVEFFRVLDVDQAAEDFIKAYWMYPKYIKFELVELEPL